MAVAWRSARMGSAATSRTDRGVHVCVRVSLEERQEKKGANELDGIWYGIRRGKRKKRVEENTYRYPGSAIPCVR